MAHPGSQLQHDPERPARTRGPAAPATDPSPRPLTPAQQAIEAAAAVYFDLARRLARGVSRLKGKEGGR